MARTIISSDIGEQTIELIEHDDGREAPYELLDVTPNAYCDLLDCAETTERAEQMYIDWFKGYFEATT